MPMPADDPLSMDLYDQPGHLIRRAHQVALSMFFDVLGRDVTPVQYAILRMLQEHPGIDQVTLAQAVALDTSTTADTAARLETKGWITREVMQRRQRRLELTEAGEQVLAGLVHGVHQMRQAMLGALEPHEGAELMRLLKKFVHLNNDQTRAPLARVPADAAARASRPSAKAATKAATQPSAKSAPPSAPGVAGPVARARGRATASARVAEKTPKVAKAAKAEKAVKAPRSPRS